MTELGRKMRPESNSDLTGDFYTSWGERESQGLAGGRMRFEL